MLGQVKGTHDGTFVRHAQAPCKSADAVDMHRQYSKMQNKPGCWTLAPVLPMYEAAWFQGVALSEKCTSYSWKSEVVKARFPIYTVVEVRNALSKSAFFCSSLALGAVGNRLSK